MAIDGRDHLPGDGPAVIHVERRESESILLTILRGLAAKENVPVTDLPSLYHRVDLDAVASLVDHGRRRNTTITIRFTVAGNEVVVSEDGHVCIWDR